MKLDERLTDCDFKITISGAVFEIRVTPEYDTWLVGLRDVIGKAKIVGRIARLQASQHWGDAKSVGDGIIELRVDYGR